VIGVRLGGEFGIVAATVERILRKRGGKQSTFAVHDRDADA
jgi:hypothetical protein